MSKRKPFKRVKVWGYVPGKRSQIFSRPAPKSQTSVNLSKKTAPSAANTEDGKAEHVDHAVSASHDIKD